MHGIKNIELNKLVKDGRGRPLVFGTKEEANKWFRLNGYPSCLAIVSKDKGMTDTEFKALENAWAFKEGRIRAKQLHWMRGNK